MGLSPLFLRMSFIEQQVLNTSKKMDFSASALGHSGTSSALKKETLEKQKVEHSLKSLFD
jgi:hypothetical protein